MSDLGLKVAQTSVKIKLKEFLLRVRARQYFNHFHMQVEFYAILLESETILIFFALILTILLENE